VVTDDDLSTVLRGPAGEADALEVRYRLVVTEGPDKGRAIEVDPAQRIMIGQSPACDVRLTDRQVSRRHAALEGAADGLRLTDVGSANGTFVQGLRVIDVLLVGGETIRLGETSIVVDRATESPKHAIGSAMRFARVVGSSPEMRRLYPLCDRLAKTSVPVVIEGETGTGKELMAESLHESSPRANGPFVVFDCTAVPPNLMESQLFGHERGAFTGAVATRRGVFEQAHGGTLFIDEIGDLDLGLQPKLLRAIERSEVQRVGSEKWLKVDVRVIAATRRDLDHEVAAGRFRDDLFFRLAVARIELPPLRRRRGDVGLLTRHFWRELGGEDLPIPPGLIERFEDAAWPGNVRELHNAVARQIALGELVEERPSLIPAAEERDIIADVLSKDLPLTRARELVVEAFERRYVEQMVERYGGNVTRAAAASGLARRYFQQIRARLSK
jgi:two-component system, NtrC family, response regulator HydG